MPVKQPEILSRADFDEAVVKLRLNVSEIAKETGIPRTYLSEFRNGDRRLRPEHLGKLRDYFEAKGIEFEDDPDAPPATAPKAPRSALVDTPPKAPHPALAAATVTRCFFPIADDLDADVIERAIDAMDENDARIAALLNQPAEREEAFLMFGEGDYTKNTKAALQEIEKLSAENYLLFRMLCGWRALRVTPTEQGKETLRDVVITGHRPRLVEAGLILPEAAPETEEEAA